jgi:hypothetical protein
MARDHFKSSSQTPASCQLSLHIVIEYYKKAALTAKSATAAASTAANIIPEAPFIIIMIFSTNAL